MRLQFHAVSFALSLFVCAPTVAAPPGVDVQNLGFAVDGLAGEGDILAFEVSEADVGDRNGDGDTLDVVPRVVDLGNDTASYVQVAAEVGAVSVGFVTLFVSEAGEGVDLNGDGDHVDRVVHVYDVANGTLHSSGLAGHSTSFAASAGVVAFSVSEAAQGGVDLNQDNDVADAVVHVFDATQGVVQNTQVVAVKLWLDGRALAMIEFEDAVDISGDGDDDDFMLHLHDVVTGATTSTGYPISPAGPIIRSPHIAFRVEERDLPAGTDLDGDGSSQGTPLFIHDASVGVTTNQFLQSFASPYFVGDRIFVSLSEFGMGDQNGDGDVTDLIPHLLDFGTGILTSLGFSEYGPVVIGDVLSAIVVAEWNEGTDLSGDGDQDDRVVFVYNDADGSVVNTGRLLTLNAQLKVSDHAVAFLTPEAWQGADLNGDGDTTDDVVSVYDAASGTVTTVPVASVFEDPTVGGRHVVLRVEEAAAGVDLNGDGDLLDRVAHVHDALAKTTANLGLAASDGEAAGVVGDDFFAFRVYEIGQGVTDLNGNGFASPFEHVLHVASGLPADCGAVEPYGAGCAGPGPSIPDLIVSGCAAAGFDLTVMVRDGTPLANAWILLGLQQATVPFGGLGCALHVTPVLPVTIGPLPLSASGDVSLPLTVPAGTPPLSVTMQAFTDTVPPATTQGVELTVQ